MHPIAPALLPLTSNRAGRCVLAACLLLLCSAPLRAQKIESHPLAPAVRTILRSEKDVEVAARKLGALGSAAAPALLDVLAEYRGLRPTPDGEKALPDGADTAVMRALAPLSPAELERELDGFLKRHDNLEARLLALEVLEACPDASSLQAAITIIAPLPAGVVGRPPLAPRFQVVLRRYLSRSPDRFRVVERSWPQIPAPLRHHALKELARQDCDSSARTLVNLLRRDGSPRASILVELSGLGLPVLLRLPRRDRRLLRGLIEDDDPQVSSRAAPLAGLFAQPGDLPLLIELLDDRRPQVNSAALRALETATARRYGRDSKRWRQWLHEERDRVGDGLDALQSDLVAKDPAIVLRGLRTADQHLLLGTPLVTLIIPLLRSPHREVRRGAASSLARLRAPEAIDPLLNLAGETRGRERREILRAVNQVAGCKHPPRDLSGWKRRVRSWRR